MIDFNISELCSLKSSWEFLSETHLPVFIYGMGDGALKILKIFEEKHIACAGFFASDEFVRGHSFEGHKVHKLSEIEEQIPEFIIVLAFACGYDSLIEKVREISLRHTVIAPDVPVIGDGLFTKEYVKDNAESFKKVFNMLCDEQSKNVFIRSIEFKITGRTDTICNISTPSSEAFDNILKLSDDEDFVDLGAYNGDTVSEFIEETKGRYSSITALEPDRRNFRKLTKACESLDNVSLFNCAGWCEDTTLTFSDSAGRQAMLSRKGIDVKARSVDSITDGRRTSFIKYDVEGAEQKALEGSVRTIKQYKPKLKVALYHRNEDIFSLPLFIRELNPSYKFYLRKLPYIPAWEINLYCI